MVLPVWCQAIMKPNVDVLSIWPKEAYFIKTFINIQIIYLK